MFVVFNADIICEYPIEKMIAFHKKHGRDGTILVTTVKDPSRYGVITGEVDGKINEFVEKP
jgi:mannose-1-phosphate guanylyltransferase